MNAEVKTNPLFTIAVAKHREEKNAADNLWLSDKPDNLPTYTLGFCAGISYYSGIMQKTIESLQKQIEELQKS